MSDIVRLSFIIFIGYALIPTVLVWYGWKGVFKRGSSTRRGVSLTFEPSLDPQVIPELSAALKAQRVRATFFLTGEQVERYPAVVETLTADGHELGIANYSGRNNWWLFPWTYRKERERTREVIRRILGDASPFYRPPGGRVNLFDLWGSRGRGRLALWSVRLRDYHEATLERIRNRVRFGDILTCDAAKLRGLTREELQQAVKALCLTVDDLRRRGLQFLTVRELALQTAEDREVKQRLRSFWNRLFFRTWRKWEYFVQNVLLGTEPVYTVEGSVFRLRRRRYQGRPMQLSDGVWLRKGDMIGELHLVNEYLMSAVEASRSSLQLAGRIVRLVRRSLPVLGEFVATRPKYRDIKAVYGITMVYRGAKELGFTVVPLNRGMFAWGARTYLRLYLSVMHPGGLGRLRRRRELLVPMRVAMSRAELVRHAPAARPGAHDQDRASV